VLASLTAVWALASPEQRADLLTGIGAVGSVVLAIMRAMLSQQSAPPPSLDRANGLDDSPPDEHRPSRLPPSFRVLAPVLLVTLPACGASALRTHATIATVASSTIAATAPLATPACDAALTSCEGRSACIDETAQRCRVAAAALEAAASATRGYIDGIEIAALADEGLAMPALLAALRALVRAWGEASATLAAIGIQLPSLPLVGALIGGAS
jgi:hypothetical protein